jgi:hypothetical protein
MCDATAVHRMPTYSETTACVVTCASGLATGAIIGA